VSSLLKCDAHFIARHACRLFRPGFDSAMTLREVAIMQNENLSAGLR